MYCEVTLNVCMCVPSDVVTVRSGYYVSVSCIGYSCKQVVHSELLTSFVPVFSTYRGISLLVST